MNQETEGNDDPNIYCLCHGYDDGTPMICCDSCNDWFHLRCVKLSQKTAKVLGEYYCPNCVKKYNIPVSVVIPEMLPDVGDIFPKDEVKTNDDNAFGLPSSTSAKDILSSLQEDFFSDVKKRKEIEAPNKKEVPPKKMKMEDVSVRKKIVEKFVEIFGKAKKQLATEIENELYSLYKGVSKDYKQRFRTLLFNLKDPKNLQLRDRVINGSITPTTLCKMTPAELAPKELVEYRKAKDEKYLKNIVIREEDVGKIKQESDVLRGETLLHTGSVSVPKKDDETKLSEIQMVESSSIISTSSLVSEELPLPESFDSINVPLIEESVINSPPEIDNEPITIPSFNEFAKQMKGKFSGSKEKVIKNPPKNKARKDKEIKEPSSSFDIPKEKNSLKNKTFSEEIGKSIWNGFAKLSTPKFKVNMFHISGEKIDKHLPKDALLQVGRMELKALHSYLSQLSLSTSRKLTLVYFEPASEEESFNYVAAFENFRSSGKAAVLKVGGNLKEAFMFPLSIDSPVPDWLKNYTHGETDRLLGAFITPASGKSEKKVSKRTESPTSTPTPVSLDSPVLINGETRSEGITTPTSTPPPISPPVRPLQAPPFPGNLIPPFLGFPFPNPNLLASLNMGIPPTNRFPFPIPSNSSGSTNSSTPLPQEIISQGLNLLAQLKQMGVIPPAENTNSSLNQTNLSQQNINSSQNSQKLQNT